MINLLEFVFPILCGMVTISNHVGLEGLAQNFRFITHVSRNGILELIFYISESIFKAYHVIEKHFVFSFYFNLAISIVETATPCLYASMLLQ